MCGKLLFDVDPMVILKVASILRGIKEELFIGLLLVLIISWCPSGTHLRFE
jgi:hypothetical protein